MLAVFSLNSAFKKSQVLHLLLRAFIICPKRAVCVNCVSSAVRVIEIWTVSSETEGQEWLPAIPLPESTSTRSVSPQVGLAQRDLPQRPPLPSSPQPVLPPSGRPGIPGHLHQAAGRWITVSLHLPQSLLRFVCNESVANLVLRIPCGPCSGGLRAPRYF